MDKLKIGLFFAGLLIVIALAFAYGRYTTAPEKVALPPAAEKAVKQAAEDADSSATAADKAAQSARKAADSTRATAKSAEDSAKDASESAKDSANSARPNK